MRRTIRVCDIRFEKRGPMATNSSNLNGHKGAPKNTSIKMKGQMTADFCGIEVLIPFNVVKNYDTELRFVSILKNL